MARNLHSFTLTDEASLEVQRMKRGARSSKVSACIMKYGNDYVLTNDGVKFWMGLRDLEAQAKKDAWERCRKLEDELSKQGVKHHLVGLLRCLSPFPRRKQVDQQEQ